MPRRAALAGLAIAIASASSALAESGPTPCVPAKVVEVFPGTAECPAAQYVVVESTGSGPWYQLSPLFVVDHCGGSPHAFGTGLYGVLDASIGKRFLFARSEAESLFGIQADSKAQSYLSQPNGRLEYDCWVADSKLIYGDYPGSMAPAVPQGKALAWTGSAWVLKDPAPVNSKGETGSLGTCPTDAGIAGSGGNAASGGGGGYTPCSGGGGGTGGASGGSGGSGATGGTSGGSGGSIASGGASSGGASSGGVSSGGAPSGGASSGGSVATGGASTGGASVGGTSSGGSGAVVTDAGLGPGSGGLGQGGCGCRARPRSSSGAWLLLALALFAARRRSRPIASPGAPL